LGNKCAQRHKANVALVAVQDFASERRAIVARTAEILMGDRPSDMFHVQYDVSSGVSVATLAQNVATLLLLCNTELFGDKYFELIDEEHRYTNFFLANILLSWLRCAGLSMADILGLLKDPDLCGRAGVAPGRAAEWFSQLGLRLARSYTEKVVQHRRVIA
jgi:hypothetical protein